MVGAVANHLAPKAELKAYSASTEQLRIRRCGVLISIPSLERDQLNQPWLYASAAAISTITTTIVIDVLFVDLCSFTDIYQLHLAIICWSDMRRCGAN
jgi:hypothetical protein